MTLPFTNFRTPWASVRAAGFTFLEIMIVIAIIAIVTALALPRMGTSDVAKLRAAAGMLVADLEFAQSDSIAHGDALRVVVFNTSTSTYSIATSATPGTPITNLVGHMPYSTTFGQERAASLSGVTISSYFLSGDNKLGFGLYGQLDQSSNATITLRCGNATVVITLDATTGAATVGNIQ